MSTLGDGNETPDGGDDRSVPDNTSVGGGDGGGQRNKPVTGDENPRIFIGNLAQPSSKDAVSEMFSEFGAISRIDFKHNFAFVIFADPASATKAVEKYDGFDQGNDKVLKIEKAVDREKKPKKEKAPKAEMQQNLHQPAQQMERGPVRRLENRVVIKGKNGEFPDGKSYIYSRIHLSSPHILLFVSLRRSLSMVLTVISNSSLSLSSYLYFSPE